MKVKNIFWQVFLFAFVIQMTKLTIWLPDGAMWANQIEYALNNRPGLYDYNLAYGHPGGTFIVSGGFFHAICGFSFSNSLTLSVSLLIALATACCAAICFLLQPQTLGWFTTGCILTISRLYNTATPPTAAAIPLVSLIILTLCWILKQEKTERGWLCFLWGGILGVSCATRLDISLFVGIPLLGFLLRWSGPRGIAPFFIGATLIFVLCDPFMWFMPARHVRDLLHKLTLHYSTFPISTTLRWSDWVNGISLAVIAIVWFLVFLYQGRLGNVFPRGVILVFLVMSLSAALLLATAKYQAIRYLYPLIIVWEILMPMVALQHPQAAGYQQSSLSGKVDQSAVWVIVGFVLPTQLLAHIVGFIT